MLDGRLKIFKEREYLGSLRKTVPDAFPQRTSKKVYGKDQYEVKDVMKSENNFAYFEKPRTPQKKHFEQRKTNLIAEDTKVKRSRAITSHSPKNNDIFNSCPIVIMKPQPKNKVKQLELPGMSDSGYKTQRYRASSPRRVEESMNSRRVLEPCKESYCTPTRSYGKRIVQTPEKQYYTTPDPIKGQGYQEEFKPGKRTHIEKQQNQATPEAKGYGKKQVQHASKQLSNIKCLQQAKASMPLSEYQSMASGKGIDQAEQRRPYKAQNGLLSFRNVLNKISKYLLKNFANLFLKTKRSVRGGHEI